MDEPGSRFKRAVQVSAATEPSSRFGASSSSGFNTFHEPRSLVAGGGGAGPGSRLAPEPGSRLVKVGETLAAYDLSAVDKEDQSSVIATINCIVRLEERMPALDITVHRDSGYYAIVVRCLNEYVDLCNWHELVRVKGGRAGMRLVRNWICNPSKGTLVVRVGMHSAAAGSLAGGIPTLASFAASSSSSSSSTTAAARKRGRVDSDAAATAATGDSVKSSVDRVLERSIVEDLARRCNLDAAVTEADRKRLLSILFHVTLLDRARPLLDIRPVQLDTEGYVLTCKGFPNLVDLDVWYEALKGSPEAEQDEALRTLRSISYNVAEGVLQLVVEGPPLAAAATKRRRVRPLDEDAE